jgi:hypothetical protein
MLEEYQRSFIVNMKLLLKSGEDFNRIVRATLQDVLGPAPTSVLLSGAKSASFATPSRFAEQMSKVFGPGAVSIFKAIEARAAKGFEVPESEGFADLMSKFSVGTDERLGTTGVRLRPLHDNRIVDDLEEYREQISLTDA